MTRKYNEMTLGICLPQVFSVDDYHDIKYIGNFLKDIIKGIRIQELNEEKYNCSPYIFIAYLDPLPSEGDIQRLVQSI